MIFAGLAVIVLPRIGRRIARQAEILVNVAGGISGLVVVVSEQREVAQRETVFDERFTNLGGGAVAGTREAFENARVVDRAGVEVVVVGMAGRND